MKRLALVFALVALAFTLAGALSGNYWLAAGNGFVAALLIFALVARLHFRRASDPRGRA
jgi:hypothetical protein